MPCLSGRVATAVPALILLSLCACASDQAAPDRPTSTARPNVLLIVADDLNTRLSAYGHPEVKTPGLDRLAVEGRRFDRAYCQFPICNPSRASLMSGWRPERTLVWSNRTPPAAGLRGATLLQDHFRAHGYLTVRLGKVYHFEEPFRWDLAEEFEYAPGTEPELEEPETRTAEAIFESKWLVTDNKDQDEPDGWVARRAVELLRQPRRQPVFMAVGFTRPHGPWIAPRLYFDMYPEGSLSLPEAPEDDLADVPLTAMKRGAEPMIPHHRQRSALSAYSACVSFMDAQLGVILNGLDELGLWDNTIVVVMGDNGIHRGEHGIWKKNSLFEVSCQVPLLIAAPGLVRRGVATDALVELVDLYPTLAELSGLPRPPGLDGVSLAPLLIDPTRRVKTAAFTYSERMGTLATSVRTDRYRFTRWPNGTAELYDHLEDPEEHTNLAGDPAFAATVAELQAVIDAGPGKVRVAN
jgi:iduronate 2-sulfatase